MHRRFREKYSLISEIKNICLHFYLCCNILNIFHLQEKVEKVQKIEIKRVSFFFIVILAVNHGLQRGYAK